MKKSFDHIAWPAIGFWDAGLITACHSEEPLRNTTYKRFRCWLKKPNSFIVDCEGSKIRIGEPRLVEPRSLLQRFVLCVTNGIVPVTFPYLIQVDTLSLEQVKELVRKNWADCKEFWDEYDLEELQTTLAACQSIREIAGLLFKDTLYPKRT